MLWRGKAAGLRRRLSRRSWAGLSILIGGVLLLFALALLVHVDADNISDSAGWVQHTDDVLLQTNSVREDLFEMQSAIRAYALTGQKDYVVGMADHRRALERGLDRLKELVADNPDQSRRFARLRALVETRVGHLAGFMGLSADQRRQVALAGAEANALLVPPQSLTGRIEQGFAAFRAVELQLLAERQDRARHLTGLMGTVSLAMALMAPVLAAVGIVLLWSEEVKGRLGDLQAQLAQAQRLSLMGETASMLAHEINQPLTAARNYLAVLLRLEPNPRQDEMVRLVRAQMERAEAVIQRLRGFIENRPVAQEKIEAATLIRDAVQLAGTIDQGITVKTEVEASLPPLWGDPVQIQQVLVNLMRNAAEAMAGRKQRQLTLIARRDGDGVLFAVADNGPGVSADMLDRLFQPGHSTKKNGMGVGLSICRRIVEHHRGRIRAQAAPEGGAIFCFTLPADEIRAVAA